MKNSRRKSYEEIHIWEFPPTKTFIRLDDKFRKKLFRQLAEIGLTYMADILNKNSTKYGIKRKYSCSNFYSWERGLKRDRGKIKNANIPLWVLIEISKFLSNSEEKDNAIMQKIENHITMITGKGKSTPITKPKIPLRLTPELVSIVFHLCGDGHVEEGIGVSHYTQTDKSVLQNFSRKLKNVFGEFKITKVEYKILIPRVITDFLKHYFKISKFGWNAARIPVKIKNLPREFLVAGLAAFIVDEGHIGENIEIYSGNFNLLKDIEEIVLKLGYKSWGIKEKYRYGKLNSYRLNLPQESSQLLYEDIKELAKEFPTCGLVGKLKNLKWMVKRTKRKWRRRKIGVTKKLIIDLLKKKEYSTTELAAKLNIKPSSTREHLRQLEKRKLVKKTKRGRKFLWKVVK